MRRRRAAALLFVGAVSLAAVFLARRARPAFPVSDIALTELYTRDAAHLRLLVGPYSRFGWHHPGPLLFYLLAPAYRVGGGNTAALHAAALMLSLTAAALAWAIASAAGGRAAGTAIALAVALLVVRLPSLAASPWNPHAVVLPAVALIAAGAAAAAGTGWALPVAVFIASLLAQSDVALVPFAAVIVAIALTRASARARVLSAAVAAVAWVLPIVEQLSHSPGNLVALWRFFMSTGRAHVGIVSAVAAWSDAITSALRPGFALATGAIVDPVILVGWRVALAAGLVGAAAAAAAFAWRKRLPYQAWFGGLAASASIVALASLTRAEPPMTDHYAFWIAGIGAADVAACASLLPWPAGTDMLVVLVSAALVGGAGLRQVDAAADGVFAITSEAPSAPRFAASIRRYLIGARVSRPLFRIDQEQWWLAAAILAELDRDGVTYAVEPDWLPMFPGRFAADGSEDAEVTLAAVGRHRDLAERPGNVTVDVSSFIHVEAIRGPRS